MTKTPFVLLSPTEFSLLSTGKKAAYTRKRRDAERAEKWLANSHAAQQAVATRGYAKPGNYAGNSLGKDMARSYAYNLLASEKSFFGYDHFVIASRECGDIKFLLSHGVKPANIFACDIDPLAREAARALGLTNVFGDIVEALKNYKGEKLGSINLDLCGTLPGCREIVRSVYALARQHDSSSDWYIRTFLTFTRGRDSMQSSCERKKYLLASIDCESGSFERTTWIEYHSNTLNRRGSPMAMALL